MSSQPLKINSIAFKNCIASTHCFIVTVEDIWKEDAEKAAANVSNVYFHCFDLK
jgi:hypothetical protein